MGTELMKDRHKKAVAYINEALSLLQRANRHLHDGKPDKADLCVDEAASQIVGAKVALTGNTGKKRITK